MWFKQFLPETSFYSIQKQKTIMSLLCRHFYLSKANSYWNHYTVGASTWLGWWAHRGWAHTTWKLTTLSLFQAQTWKIFTCKGKTTKPREDEAEGLTNKVSSSCCKFAEPVTFSKSAASTWLSVFAQLEHENKFRNQWTTWLSILDGIPSLFYPTFGPKLNLWSEIKERL